MPAPLLPPPRGSGPAPEPGRRERWPWLVAALTIALIATSVALIVVNRDRADARRALASLREPAGDQSEADASAPDQSSPGSSSPSWGDGPQGDAPTGDKPQDPPPSTAPSNPLQDLLGQLFGDSGTSNLDPACLGMDGSNALNGLTGDPIQGTVEEQVAKITEFVQSQRGVRFEHPVKPEFLTSEQFDQRLAAAVEKEYPASQADVDTRTLGLLGAVPKGTDMKALQASLMTGQVAGYYDPETGDLVVRVPDGGGSLDATSQVTLAHELDHALTDQALGLPDTAHAGQSDANLARLALVEGDATLLMQQFSMQSVGMLGQLGAAMSPDALGAQKQLQNVPAYLQSELMFPYLTGLEYTCRLYQDGGWPAVDAAYRGLPRTSAEVMFAENAGLAAVDPRDPAQAPGGWTVARTDTFGAAQLLWLMQAPGGDTGKALDQALDAARHWAGGETVLSTRGDESALGIALVDNRDGGTLCSAVESWYQAAFDAQRSQDGDAVVMKGGGQVGVARCDGREVRLGIAPDLATATRLAS